MQLPMPRSRADISRTQSERKRVAFERARRAPFYAGRLDHIDIARLDDPDEWRRIPITDKDQLRAFSPPEFYRQFCVAPKDEIAEYWRSGGVTGAPLFYPRTFDDVRISMEAWRRSWPCMGCRKGDLAHISFPLGIHPAGQMWARSALDAGIGMNWVGPGNAVPTQMQLQLIQLMKPTIWMGMSSYGLHLANVAEAQGVDLAASSVKKVVVSAEPLSQAKREKLERQWGAKVYDVFGMSEAGLMGAETDAGDGYHIWTDMYVIEVINVETGEPAEEGEPGSLVVTPLWSNHATPFLRWNSGDIVTFREAAPGDHPFSVFPVIKHSHRTAGFFKIRGININHAEYEDFMFAMPEIADFKAELVTLDDGLDRMRVSVEINRVIDGNAARAKIESTSRAKFEVAPEVVILERGTLAREFEASVKAPRFIDRRG